MIVCAALASLPRRAIALSFTGPVLRSAGVNYYVRKATPYLIYDRLDFEVPLGEQGDNYDRYLVRMEEMRQSIRIVEQCMQHMPPGPVQLDDTRMTMPSKDEVYGTIEGLMNHFKLIIEGIKPPPGEAYFPVEGANGELGFYIISDGTGRPYRCRVRPPCFALMQGLQKMLKGGMVADIVATFGTLNMIAGAKRSLSERVVVRYGSAVLEASQEQSNDCSSATRPGVR